MSKKGSTTKSVDRVREGFIGLAGVVGGRRLATAGLVGVAMITAWMGYDYGGYYVDGWGLAALVLAAGLLAVALAGFLGGARSWWSVAATSLFIGYAAWTFLSLMWSPNRGDAWVASGQTLLYLIAFWLVATLVALGASRRWALAATAFGPGLVAIYTILTLPIRTDDYFVSNRFMGTVGYFNGEAAFLLVPFWVSIYVAGTRRIHPAVRAVALAGAVFGAEVAVLAQSRGAMVAMALSLPVYFLFSGQRVRGFFALAPIILALIVAFPDLNEVYQEFLAGGDPRAALEDVTALIWLTTLGAGAYGLIWGILDRRLGRSANAGRAGLILAAACIVPLATAGAFTFAERVGNPVSWGQETARAFIENDQTGVEESRYLSAGGSGRFTLWQVAWEDFTENPILGVGSHNYEATYYQEREADFGTLRQPHSLPLEALAERGVVGGMLFFGFLGVCVAAGLRERFRNLNSEGKAHVGAMLAAITYWFVHSSAEWFWQIPAVTLPAILYLAMLVAPWRRLRGGEDAFAPSDRPLKLAGVGLAVLAFATITPLYAAHVFKESAQNEDNPWVALRRLEFAQAMNPLDPELARREGDLALRIGDVPRATQSYALAIQLNPEHYAPYSVLGGLYEQIGQDERAAELYQRSLQLNPLDPALQENAARTEAQTPEESGESGASSD
ncbi:MAG: O-antigen ligase family protein [Actinomycetota bacterium]|nr:O-antigen ligase family protein [Actinomycetota bacterium]